MTRELHLKRCRIFDACISTPRKVVNPKINVFLPMETSFHFDAQKINIIKSPNLTDFRHSVRSASLRDLIK
jgi:hypothetical protein